MRLLYRSSPPPASSQSPSTNEASSQCKDAASISSTSQAFRDGLSSKGRSQQPRPGSVPLDQSFEGRQSSQTSPETTQAAAAAVAPGVLPRASYAAMQAAWLGADSALPQMSLTRLLVMFFLERSVAGLSSAWQQLILIGALLLPLSSTTSLSVMTIMPHVAIPDTWLVRKQQSSLPMQQQPQQSQAGASAFKLSDQESSDMPQEVSQSRRQESFPVQEGQHSRVNETERSFANMHAASSQTAPELRSASITSIAQQRIAQGQPAEAWEEAASMVQVSLALGLQVGSPVRPQPSRESLREHEWTGAESLHPLAHSSMTSTISSLGSQSADLSRSSSIADDSSAESDDGGSVSRTSFGSLSARSSSDASSAADMKLPQGAQVSQTKTSLKEAGEIAGISVVDEESQEGVQSLEHFADMGRPISAQEAIPRADSNSSSSSSRQESHIDGYPIANQQSGSSSGNAASVAAATSMAANDSGTPPGSGADGTPVPEQGHTKAAVPASSLEAWPGKGYFAIGKTLYLMPRAAESQPDLSAVPDAGQEKPSSGMSGTFATLHLLVTCATAL